jgi:hypothetical protein
MSTQSDLGHWRIGLTPVGVIAISRGLSAATSPVTSKNDFDPGGVAAALQKGFALMIEPDGESM